MEVLNNAAGSEELANACAQGELDAQTDVNGTLWGAIGFFFSILGIVAAYLIEPAPPAARLVGKSQEYIQVYTDCYKRKGKSVQGKKAITGFVVGILVGIALAVLWVGCIGLAFI